MHSLVLALLACSTETPDAPTAETALSGGTRIEGSSAPVALTPDELAPPVEVLPPIGFGNIIVTEVMGTGWGVDLRAGFTPEPLPFVNWVECAMGYGLCIGAPPALPDTPVDVPGHLTWESMPPRQRVGGTIQVGPYATNGYVSQDGDYWGEGDAWVEGPLDVSWSAGPDWPAFTGIGVFPMAEHLEGVEPPSASDHVVDRDGVFALSWTPGTDPIQLDVVAKRPGGTQVRRTYALEDDGYFELDIAALGLHPDDHEVEVALARVRYATVDVEGNPVSLVSRSEAAYRLHVADPRRTFVVPGSSCADAPVLGSGTYHGEVVPNDVSYLSVGCARFSSFGEEALFAVDLQPGERLIARGSMVFDVYDLIFLLPDCGDAGTCVGGAYREGAEVGYVNESDQVERLHVVLDTHRRGPWFELDLEIDAAPEPVAFASSCAEAIVGEPAMGSITGSYAEALAADPETDPELFLPVTIGAGEQLVVSSVGEVAGLKLLGACEEGLLPLARGFRDASLSWRNAGSEAVQAVLEVSGPQHEQQPSTFDLEIDSYAPTLLAAVDTCADLAAAEVLSTGIHRTEGSTLSFEDDVDLAFPGPSCTTEATDGADGMVLVELQPGETIDVRYLLEGAVGAVYLLEQCGDAATTLACGFQPQHWSDKPPASTLSWTNEGTDVTSVVLVVDSFAFGGLAGHYSLDVDIH